MDHGSHGSSSGGESAVIAAALTRGMLRLEPPDKRRTTASLSLREFCVAAWPVLEPGRQFVPNWHLDAICDHLEAVTRGDIRNLIINIPPRHMKSLTVSVFWPVWEWSFSPHIRWLYSSYVQPLATRDAVKSRRLLDSAWYRSRWGEVFHLTSDQNQKQRYENSRTGYRIATGVGAGTGEGGDRVIVDDPHNVRQAESDAKREEAIAWWNETMSTRGNDPRTVAKVVIMQRVHDSDLTGHLLEQGGYEHLCLPARYEPTTYVTSIGFEDPRREEGELLWPQHFGEKELADLERQLGSYAAAAQLQQRPAPAGGGLIKRDWFKFYRRSELPQVWEELLQSWDLSFKGTTSSSYVVGQVWARSGANCYLMDQFREQTEFPGTVRAVLALSKKWPQAKAKLIESKANGPAVVQTLRQKVPGLIEIEPGGGKEARVHAVSPFIEAGNVWLPDPTEQPWIGAFLLECERFPKGTHSDQVDAMTQALVRLGQHSSAWLREAAVARGEESEVHRFLRESGSDTRPGAAGRITARRF